MNELRQVIADALSTDLTSAQYLDIQNQIDTRRREVSARLAAIKPVGKHGGEAGPERRKALISGTPDDVRAIENEYADLSIEAEQLDMQRQAIRNRLDSASHKEAAESIPAMLKDLESRMTAIESTRDQLNTQLQEFDSAYNAVVTARSIAIRGGHIPATPKPRLAERIRAFAPWAEHLRTRVFGRHCDHSEELGITFSQGHLGQSL